MLHMLVLHMQNLKELVWQIVEVCLNIKDGENVWVLRNGPKSGSKTWLCSRWQSIRRSYPRNWRKQRQRRRKQDNGKSALVGLNDPCNGSNWQTDHIEKRYSQPLRIKNLLHIFNRLKMFGLKIFFTKTENLNRDLNLSRSTKFAQNSAKIILGLTFAPLESYSLNEERKDFILMFKGCEMLRKFSYVSSPFLTFFC